jgi:hypothetical protein
MHKKDIPQDKDDSLYEEKFGDGLLKYVLDENNHYTSGLSSGWSPEIIVLQQAMDDLEAEKSEVVEKVRNHLLSPIAYYAVLKRMDINVLSAYTGLMKWRIRRHYKPKIFDKLSTKVLTRYANVFEIPIDNLKNYQI